MKIKNFIGHLSTINHHRFLVMKLCFKTGLYWQGLTHDLSKYSFVEFWSGVKYFQGDRSPIDAEKLDKGYSEGWLHHKGHNKHHFQYWVDSQHGQFIVNEIPKKYLKEMLCDKVAACMVYQKEKYHPSSALEFWLKGKDRNLFPKKSYETLEKYLRIVAENDLDKALEIIKKD